MAQQLPWSVLVDTDAWKNLKDDPDYDPEKHKKEKPKPSGFLDEDFIGEPEEEAPTPNRPLSAIERKFAVFTDYIKELEKTKTWNAAPYERRMEAVERMREEGGLDKVPEAYQDQIFIERIPGLLQFGGESVARAAFGFAGMLEEVKVRRAKDAFKKQTGMDYDTATAEQQDVTLNLGGEGPGAVYIKARDYIEQNEKAVEIRAKMMKEGPLAQDPRYAPRDWFEQFVVTSPQIAAQVVAAITTGGTGSSILMFTQIAEPMYEKFRAEGTDVTRAAQLATVAGLMQIPFEYIGISKALKFFKTPGVIGRVKNIFSKGITEGITEFLQSYSDASVQVVHDMPDATPMEQLVEFAKRAPEQFSDALTEGSLGMAFGAILGAFTSATQPERLDREMKPLDKDVDPMNTGVPGVKLVGTNDKGEYRYEILDGPLKGERFNSPKSDVDVVAEYMKRFTEAVDAGAFVSRQQKEETETVESKTVPKAEMVPEASKETPTEQAKEFIAAAESMPTALQKAAKSEVKMEAIREKTGERLKDVPVPVEEAVPDLQSRRDLMDELMRCLRR